MKRNQYRNLVTAGLALCVAILALLAAFVDVGGVSTVRGANAEETPIIAPWEAGILTDTAPPVIAVEVTPEPIPRYAAVDMSEDERQELAGIVNLEAGNQCAKGQQAVVEVVLNRVISPEFPDTVHDVLHQGEDTARPQFSTIGNLALAEPVAAQYEAIDAALYGPSILPEDVVFFYKYIWE